MSEKPRVFVPPGSRMRGFAETIAWLWRLGRVSDHADPGAVGFGWLEEAPELQARLAEGGLAGAVVFAPRPGPEVGPVPGRERKLGVAAFGAGERIGGRFTVLHGGEPVVSSSVGVHAARVEQMLVFGVDPDATWGTLEGYWLYGALADFLAERLTEPLLLMPPVGWFRYDDVPGNAFKQLFGHKPQGDPYWRKRLRRLRKTFGEAGAIANLAISARALEDGELVPIERIWPGAIEEVRAGIEAGVFEPIAHGYSHNEPAAFEAGKADPREFRRVDQEAAGELLDEAVAWMTEATGVRPGSFVAPTWSYGAGVIAALEERGIRSWLPVGPGPLYKEGFARESLVSTLDGMHQLDLRPIGRLAQAGVPPTVVMHGGLFDNRTKHLKPTRDPITLARLLMRRDMLRVPAIEGVRWIGSREMLDRLAAHDGSRVDGGVAHLPAGAEAILFDGSERRAVSG